MESGLYYLAGPHKGTVEEEKYRFEASIYITSKFLTEGISTFSPIVYGKQIADACNFNSLEERRSKIMTYLLEFLKVCKGMILVTMKGWEQSWGARQELLFCQNNEIPVYLMDPQESLDNYKKILSVSLTQIQLQQVLDMM
jgi:hypothetical protein